MCCDHQARSRKAFDIRLENLQKSKAEKEEIHRKLQDKYTKEMAEFEKKVRPHIHISIYAETDKPKACGQWSKCFSCLLCPHRKRRQKRSRSSA